MVFYVFVIFLTARLQRESEKHLRRSATLIDLLEPYWYKRLYGVVVLQTSIWELWRY